MPSIEPQLRETQQRSASERPERELRTLLGLTAHAGLPFPGASAGQVEKAASPLTIQDVSFLLNLLLERKTLPRSEALRYVKEKFKRNKASARTHLRQYEQTIPKPETCLTL